MWGINHIISIIQNNYNKFMVFTNNHLMVKNSTLMISRQKMINNSMICR